jgi:hydrogenase nickel insertion protein HypA
MHELHIVRDLVATLEQQAIAQGAARVTKVKLKFNPLIAHDADHVQFTFDVVKKDRPLLASAALELERVPGLVRCLECSHEFEANALPGICPRCHSVRLQPRDHVGVVLQNYEIER